MGWGVLAGKNRLAARSAHAIWDQQTGACYLRMEPKQHLRHGRSARLGEVREPTSVPRLLPGPALRLLSVYRVLGTDCATESSPPLRERERGPCRPAGLKIKFCWGAIRLYTFSMATLALPQAELSSC